MESEATVRKCDFVASQDILVQSTPNGTRILCPAVKGLFCNYPGNDGVKCQEMERDERVIVRLPPPQ
ncbi:hypothetical protein M1271_00310 [Patescibacteria group bacterium]|nr:hypothetical protein [Patescibacteria group bacterium]